MINEVIENLYTKYGDYYIEGLVIETKTGNFYSIFLNGFSIADRDILKEYTLNTEYNFKGCQIINVGSNVASIIIELSDKRFIDFNANGIEGMDFEVWEGEDYLDLKRFLETETQHLTIENNFAEIR